jgi:metalloprotein, YbeY/UPF0054 family
VGIQYFNQDISFVLPQKRVISRWIKQVSAEEERKIGNVCFIFCDDNYLLNINKEYLKHDFYTDVITFDDSENNIISGDIFISIDTVKENATLYSKDFLDEMHRVLVHGVLHLCGYHDKSDVEERHMRFLEDKYLAFLENK